MKRGIPGLFLSSHNKVLADKLKTIYRAGTVALLLDDKLGDDEFEKLIILTLLAKKRYYAVVRSTDIEINSRPSLKRNIDSFEERQYWAFFNTTREHLHLLYSELLFDEEYVFDSGNRMSGEEVLLLLYYILTS
jgi:hypothetical protein